MLKQGLVPGQRPAPGWASGSDADLALPRRRVLASLAARISAWGAAAADRKERPRLFCRLRREMTAGRLLVVAGLAIRYRRCGFASLLGASASGLRQPSGCAAGGRGRPSLAVQPQVVMEAALRKTPPWPGPGSCDGCTGGFGPLDAVLLGPAFQALDRGRAGRLR